MEDLIPKFFSGDTSLAVTPEELKQLAMKCHSKIAELNTAFKPDIDSFQRDCEKADCTEVERCAALFHILQRRGRFKTWRDFQQEFSRFSIFCRESSMEIAGRSSESDIPLESLPSPSEDQDRTVEDEKHESSVSSNGMSVSEDVPRSQTSAVPPMSPSQHRPYNILDSSQHPKEENVSESAVNSSGPDVLPTSHDDVPGQSTAESARPSMKDLANQVVPTVCPMWRDIGLQLNLDITILNEIRANCQGDVRECCTVMFDKWLKQDTKALWCTVLIACKRVKENLSSGPDKLCTKDHIEALTKINNTLPVFLASL